MDTNLNVQSDELETANLSMLEASETEETIRSSMDDSHLKDIETSLSDLIENVVDSGLASETLDISEVTEGTNSDNINATSGLNSILSEQDPNLRMSAGDSLESELEQMHASADEVSLVSQLQSMEKFCASVLEKDSEKMESDTNPLVIESNEISQSTKDQTETQEDIGTADDISENIEQHEQLEDVPISTVEEIPSEIVEHINLEPLEALNDSIDEGKNSDIQQDSSSLENDGKSADSLLEDGGILKNTNMEESDTLDNANSIDQEVNVEKQVCVEDKEISEEQESEEQEQLHDSEKNDNVMETCDKANEEEKQTEELDNTATSKNNETVDTIPGSPSQPTGNNKENSPLHPSEHEVLENEKEINLIPDKNQIPETIIENVETAEEILDSSKEKSSQEMTSRADENGTETTEFVQVNTDSGKDDNDKDDNESNKGENPLALLEQDPIASDGFESLSEDREGADAELCIIPDTERVISQAEKDAASSIPPLRDISESASTDDATSTDTNTDSSTVSAPIVIFKYDKEDHHTCIQCTHQRKVNFCFARNDANVYICDDNCMALFKEKQTEKVVMSWEEGGLRVKNFSGVPTKDVSPLSFTRMCAACKKTANDVENNLSWEIMDFCNEFCLSKYQKEIGSRCSSCSGEVKSNSLGKYCVRFGNDIRQFCTSHCLEEYKKGLKVCSYCQQDMSGGSEGFLAPVGDKGQFKDFCSQLCMEKYDVMTNDRPPKVAPGTRCSVCKTDKPISIEFELEDGSNYFCSEPCFVAFCFVNNIVPGKCAMCRRNFQNKVLEKNTMYYDNVQHSFCSNSCQNIYIIAHRKIVPCSWCKVKKYNFDMIRRYSKSGPQLNMCSINCLRLYQVSLDAVKAKKTPCNYCHKNLNPIYHLTMSDATIRNFCSYSCVMAFQNQFPKQPITLKNIGESPVPTGAPKKNKKNTRNDENGGDGPTLPVIASVQSLAASNGVSTTAVTVTQNTAIQAVNTRSTRSKTNSNIQQQTINSISDLPIQIQVRQHYIVRPAPVPDQRNIGTLCRVRSATKGISATPTMVDKGVQTDEREAQKILIPVPVPIYVPAPLHMFAAPVPFPVPFPLPIPIPIFIPTTRNSANGIMKEIKKIQVKIPADPYEAELLMMAEMVAEEKKEENTDSESDVEDTGGAEDGTFSPEAVDASHTFGDDMLQMALKMATELDEPAVDLEGALTANTITAPQGGDAATEESVDDPQPMHHIMERASLRGRKRGMRQSRSTGAKRGRRMSHQVDMPMMTTPAQPPPPAEPAEKPDAHMCLKYTFGVNAWKQWVTTKNAELEKSTRPAKLFKTEILQLTADELNYSLCLFVKEVRKPNGAEYAPDTIYYLCLGIQQYLFENGRIDNIFCDPYYEKFTDCLDEVAKKFSVLYNDSHYIVTRVEEEHLWESKQLGAHSPHVLLSTLMFFNTKHFNLTSVDEHMQLSFSHIMKHWKRNPNQPGASKVTGSRNVLLRFYPPQSAIQNNTRKKKVYEQQENEENPLRCPVKLYEFYLSKCPESVKTRNDVFYLQPERSCVPDSPVWYSTMPLPREALEKMLHRVKMVKEINVALLTS